MERMEQIEKLAFLSARLLLESGAETYRVEETVGFIARKMGAAEAEVLALPTGCLYTLVDETGVVHSRVVRVHARNTDLSAIARVNEISRGLVEGRLTAEEALERLEAVRKQKPAPFALEVLASAVTAGAFSLLFQGSLFEFVVSAICGGFTWVLSRFFGAGLLPSSFHLFVSGALSALIAQLSALLYPSAVVSAIIVGAIMPLLPGLLITNAIRDTVGGDLISGVARSAEALIRSVSIAAGVGVVLALWRMIG